MMLRSYATCKMVIFPQNAGTIFNRPVRSSWKVPAARFVEARKRPDQWVFPSKEIRSRNSVPKRLLNFEGEC